MALAHIEKRAERIKDRREELGLTQEQIADRMQDKHRELYPDEEPDRTRGQMVSDWERAVNEPSAPKLELLAAALEWTVADLNAGQPEKRTTPDLMGSLNGSQLDRIEGMLREVLDLLDPGAELAEEAHEEQVERAIAGDVPDPQEPAEEVPRKRAEGGSRQAGG